MLLCSTGCLIFKSRDVLTLSSYSCERQQAFWLAFPKTRALKLSMLAAGSGDSSCRAECGDSEHTSANSTLHFTSFSGAPPASPATSTKIGCISMRKLPFTSLSTSEIRVVQLGELWFAFLGPPPCLRAAVKDLLLSVRPAREVALLSLRFEGCGTHLPRFMRRSCTKRLEYTVAVTLAQALGVEYQSPCNNNESGLISPTTKQQS